MGQDQALLRAISEDRALGSAMLFSHRHEFATPDFHVSIMDLWRCADEFVLIEAFREGAKTTLAEEFLCMEACYGNFFYTVIFGETYAKACQKIEAIAYEAKTNVKLGKLFGRRVLSRKPIENKIWFESGALIECAGWEQEVTGFKHLSQRPDRFYLDDVENEERVRDSDAVQATVTKLYKEIIPAGDKARLKVRVTETPRAVDCLVTRLRANPDWLCASFPICDGAVDDPKTVSAWPSKYPMEWVRKRRDQFERAGLLRVFQQEYLLNVDTSEAKPFTEEMIRSMDVAPAAWLPRYAIYDPSRTSNPATSCRVGKVVVSRFGSKIIVHESSGEFWKPDETRANIFATQERHHCAEIGIEKDSLDDYLMQPIRYEMMRRGRSFSIRAMNAPRGQDKDSFIMGLQPFFAAGDVVLVGGRGMHPQLVAEILNFPGGKKDTLNALAYALRMFAGTPVYEDFGEANVGPAHDPVIGETVYTAWNANASEVVCAAVLRSGRHLSVARDWAVSGPTSDAVKSIVTELRAEFKSGKFECYVPAELHDAWQRVPLVPALRVERMVAWRGEHVAVARGALADKIRTTMRERRLLCVDRRAPLTLNAIAAGYKYPLSGSGKQQHEPEAGISRLLGEALECLIAVLERSVDNSAESGNYATNPQGARFRTALPTRRA